MEDMIYGIPFMTIKIKGDPNPRGIKTNKNNQYQSSKVPIRKTSKSPIINDFNPG